MLRGNEMLQQTPVMLQGFICYCTSRDFSSLLSITFCHSLSFPFSACFCICPFFFCFLQFLCFPSSLFLTIFHLLSLLLPLSCSLTLTLHWISCSLYWTMLCLKPKSSVKLQAFSPFRFPVFFLA